MGKQVFDFDYAEGEGRGKWENKFSTLTMPNRFLSSIKIAKGEGRGPNSFVVFYRAVM